MRNITIVYNVISSLIKKNILHLTDTAELSLVMYLCLLIYNYHKIIISISFEIRKSQVQVSFNETKRVIYFEN